MEKLSIHTSPALQGEVAISGAKNAALPILMASILADSTCHFDNVPHLRDINTSVALLSDLGIKAKRADNDVLELDPSGLDNYTASYDLVKTMRASILVLGPLLAKYGQANVSLPGGCAIGARPVNLHLDGLKQMGANIEVEAGYVRASVDGRLKGAHIFMDMVSVGATENLMMAAALADGQTVLENAAREPEIVDLANCLNRMGAKVSGAGTDSIKIAGVQRLHGCHYRVLPDRIETGTFLVAAAVTGGKITCTNAAPKVRCVFGLCRRAALRTGAALTVWCLVSMKAQ